MTQPEQNEGRPLPGAASKVITHDDSNSVATATDSDVRCRRCHVVLTAARSRKLGVGPTCRKAVAA